MDPIALAMTGDAPCFFANGVTSGSTKPTASRSTKFMPCSAQRSLVGILPSFRLVDGWVDDAMFTRDH